MRRMYNMRLNGSICMIITVNIVKNKKNVTKKCEDRSFRKLYVTTTNEGIVKM